MRGWLRDVSGLISIKSLGCGKSRKEQEIGRTPLPSSRALCVFSWPKETRNLSEVSFNSTGIPSPGLHPHDLVTSQRLHLQTLSPWDSDFNMICFFFFETRSPYIAQAGLNSQYSSHGPNICDLPALASEMLGLPPGAQLQYTNFEGTEAKKIHSSLSP